MKVEDYCDQKDKIVETVYVYENEHLLIENLTKFLNQNSDQKIKSLNVPK